MAHVDPSHMGHTWARAHFKPVRHSHNKDSCPTMLTTVVRMGRCRPLCTTVAAALSNNKAAAVRPPSHYYYCCFFSTRRRRRRKGYFRFPPDDTGAELLQQRPFAHGYADFQEYQKVATLSPWVPIPDAVARRGLDLVLNNRHHDHEEEFHVDLGSGDGRLCFTAHDHFQTKMSVGIDVDDGILQVARDRLARRHPVPVGLHFVQADLLLQQPTHAVWSDYIQKATVLTMYFATEGLQKLRPLLEEKLTGRNVRIVSFGYAVPGWQAHQTEVVLGTTIYVYQWGHDHHDTQHDEEEEGEAEHDEEEEIYFAGPDLVEPHEYQNPLEQQQREEKFAGANVIDQTGKFSIRGFNPDRYDTNHDDDDELDWTDEEESDSSDNDGEEDSKNWDEK